MADEFWVDPSLTNGSGSFGSPFNSYANAMAAVVNAETKVHLKRGFVYAAENRSRSAITSKRPAGYLVIDHYGDALLPPTFDAGTWEPPGSAVGWSYIGDGVWKKAYGATGTDATVKRVYIGQQLLGGALNNSKGTGWSQGIAVARTPIAYNANEATVLANIATPGSDGLRLWAHINQPSGFLYIYTGSDRCAPPAFYGGLYIVGGDSSTFGSVDGVIISDSANVTLDGISSIGGVDSQINVRTFNVGVDSDLVTVRNCTGYMGYGLGITLRGQGTSFVRRTKVEDCVVDSVSTLAEDWNFRTGTGISWMNGAQDLFRVQHNVSGAAFRRCRAKDPYHVGFSYDTSSGTINSSDNLLVEDCVVESPNRLYGHSIAVGGTGNNCTFNRVIARDCTQFAQLSGKCFIRNCLSYNFKRPYAAYNGQGNVNAEAALWVATFAPWSTLAAGDIVIDNITLVNSYGFPIQFVSGSSGSIADGAVTIRNSIIVDTQYFNAGSRARAVSSSDPASSIFFALNPAEAVPSVTMANNYLYTATTGQSIVLVLQGGSASRQTLAGMAGASGNSEADPQLTPDFRLKSTSPCRGTATFLRLERDLAGIPRPQTPSHGAYEYQA